MSNAPSTHQRRCFFRLGNARAIGTQNDAQDPTQESYLLAFLPDFFPFLSPLVTVFFSPLLSLEDFFDAVFFVSCSSFDSVDWVGLADASPLDFLGLFKTPLGLIPFRRRRFRSARAIRSESSFSSKGPKVPP